MHGCPKTKSWDGLRSRAGTPGRASAAEGTATATGRAGGHRCVSETSRYGVWCVLTWGMFKYLDLPPLWLAAALGVVWCQKTYLDLGVGFGPVWADALGGVLVGAGGLLIVLAAYEMRKHRTTIIPHNAPDALVTTGIFRQTRNPIYLADSLILTGMIFYWDAVLSLPVIPVFMAWIAHHFIRAEEHRLRHHFPAEFTRYSARTRRWL